MIQTREEEGKLLCSDFVVLLALAKLREISTTSYHTAIYMSLEVEGMCGVSRNTPINEITFGGGTIILVFAGVVVHDNTV